MPLVVETPNDWLRIAALGGPVVDPMIVRCGELFLRGASGVDNPDGAWDLITRNIHALGTFFDRLIIDERIPVFNYADTFDYAQNFDRGTLGQVNANQEVLVDVQVGFDAYNRVKTAALQELTTLFAGPARITSADAESVLGELAGAGYAWYPDLGVLVLPSENERRLAAFILGGLIFGAYAQQAGTSHLMQPKRSRLFLATALGETSERRAEDYLFEKLAELGSRRASDIPYTPTFFPMLLAQSENPVELLMKVFELRESGEVADYRSWLSEAIIDFDTNGRISGERAREVQAIADAIKRKTAGLPVPEVEIKVTVADLAAGSAPAGVDLAKPASALWGWIVEQLPGRRHRKLLSRAVIADRDYAKLDRRVRTVWSGQGFTV